MISSFVPSSRKEKTYKRSPVLSSCTFAAPFYICVHFIDEKPIDLCVLVKHISIAVLLLAGVSVLNVLFPLRTSDWLMFAHVCFRGCHSESTTGVANIEYIIT